MLIQKRDLSFGAGSDELWGSLLARSNEIVGKPHHSLDGGAQQTALPAAPKAPSSAPLFEDPSRSEPELPKRNDNRFNPSLELYGVRGRCALDKIYRMVARGEGRRRARKSTDLKTFLRTLSAVVANAYWAETFTFNPKIAYYRRKGFHQGPPYPPWCTPENLVTVVDGCQQVGVLDTSVGHSARSGSPPLCSTFSRSKLLLHVLRAHRITPESLRLDASAYPLVIRKDVDKKFEPVDLETDLVAASFAATLASYNDFLAEHCLRVRCSSRAAWAELLKDLEARAGRPSTAAKPWREARRPEYFKIQLHRVFNHSRWDKGGRFYGGWWQQLPSRWRPYITIDRQKTVELDYSGCAVRMIYHQRRIDYSDDPYQLPEADKVDPPYKYREHAKRMLQAMINSSPETDLRRVNIGPSLPTRLPRSALIKWLHEKHQVISDVFRTGEGLSLQFVESEIAEAIMVAGQEAGICVLPVHDSFIVPATCADWLEDQMIQRYVERLGFSPTIGGK